MESIELNVDANVVIEQLVKRYADLSAKTAYDISVRDAKIIALAQEIEMLKTPTSTE